MFKRKSLTIAIMLFFAGSCCMPALGLSADRPAPKKGDAKTLVLYNWEDYIGSHTLENFHKATGIRVKEVNFKDEEEMLGAMQADLSAYDLVVASGDLIREMQAAKIISPIDHAKIPNYRYIDPAFTRMPFDPGNRYSVPYLFGTTGLLINKKFVQKNTDSLKVLFDPQYKGRLAMLNNAYEMAGAAAKLLGYPLNITESNQFAEVEKLLLTQKPLLQGYLDVMTIKKRMVSEKLWAAQMYSGEGLAAADENEDLVYVIPREGAAIWVDSFAIPRDAKHKPEVHIFLDYILKPDVNAAIASELWYATPNTGASPLMDPEVRQSPSVYPTTSIRDRCEFYSNVGEATTMYTRLWSRLTVDRK